MSPEETRAPSSAIPTFPTTRWSMVLAAGSGSPALGEALASLCQRYWLPVYSYVRRSGKGPEEAQDLTQEFFRRVIEFRFVAGADREKGRFRSFLITVLKRFLINEWQAGQTLKRGGGREVISLNAVEAEERYRLEPVDHLTADRIFDRRWAMTLLELVMVALREEQQAAGRGELFAQLTPYLYGDQADQSQREIGRRFGLSEAAVKSAVHRLRGRYRELLRAEVLRTVAVPPEAEDELQALLTALRTE